MTKTLRIGYIPLVDSALLHVARAYDFAAAEGLDLDLVRETSWANIRDKLGVGIFDAAHMLAPSAMAVCLGLGYIEIPLVAPVALGLDGNAITLSQTLYDEVMAAVEGDPADPYVTAQALAKVIAKRRALGAAPLTFAHVFPFSTHHYQLRLWFAAGGLESKTDVNLIVVPPPFMVESLRSGVIDGFCVGAPWNGLAVAASVGQIIHRGRDIVRNCPEKLLAFRADVASADLERVAALSRAIRAAADWAADQAHIEDLADLMARDAGLNVPVELLCAILDPTREPKIKTATIRLDRAATYADPAHADWLYAQMRAAGQAGAGLDAKARSVYRPDLAGDAALEPPENLKLEVFSRMKI
jgi:NitT/TauT family transport system ATP-binding protein